MSATLRQTPTPGAEHKRTHRANSSQHASTRPGRRKPLSAYIVEGAGQHVFGEVLLVVEVDVGVVVGRLGFRWRLAHQRHVLEPREAGRYAHSICVQLLHFSCTALHADSRVPAHLSVSYLARTNNEDGEERQDGHPDHDARAVAHQQEPHEREHQRYPEEPAHAERARAASPG